MKIRTVKGDINKEDMGITLSHEHLVIDLERVRNNKYSTYGYSDLIIKEVKKAKALGIRTFVEMTTIDMGRDVQQLKKISEECDVNIVAATGFYLNEYHYDFVEKEDKYFIANIFIKELTEGIDNTEIKAGVIGEIAFGKEMRESEKKVFEAACIAHNKLGCAINTHCNLGTLAEKQIQIFEEYKVDPSKIILGHIDLSDNVEYMIKILDKGYNIAFDTIGKINYLSDEKRINNLIELILRGYEKQILLSQDVSRISYFTEKGFYGFTNIMKKFIPELKNRGISEETITNLLINNPARIFAF